MSIICKTTAVDIFELVLKREKALYTGCIGFSIVPPELLFLEREHYLQPHELSIYENMLPERKKPSFLQGRYIAKRVVSAYLQDENLKNIGIKSGVFNQPLVVYSIQPPPSISIAHTDQYAACLAFAEEHPMGVDVECIDPVAKESIRSQMTAYEQNLNRHEEENAFYTRLWTIKEALSKVLKTGLLIPFEILEIASLHVYEGYTISTFTNFVQYKGLSFYREGHICTIVLPKETDCELSAIVNRVKPASVKQAQAINNY